jgi:hypothetical protein
MSSLPPCREVDVFGHRYRISVEEMSTDEMGRCDTTIQKITIRSDLLPDACKDTLLHEISHAMAFHLGIEDPASEETWVSRSSTGLRTILCANPDLAQWIFSR